LDAADGNPGHNAHTLLKKGYNDFEGNKRENKFNDKAGELGNLDLKQQDHPNWVS
jgi:hypothetical protein